ncbi:MAG TPA: hypothetical protein VF808_05920 [Ktedonobacterales bacterium]
MPERAPAVPTSAASRMTQRPTPPDAPTRSARDAGGARWKVWAFGAAGAIAPRVPLGLARRLMVAGGWLTWALASGLRRRAEWNLGHIPALAGDPAARREAARQVFATLALNYLDFFRGRTVSREELSRGWRIEGWEVVEQALALGKGAIVLSAHYGPFEYAAWKLGELGYSIVTPAERLKPEELHQLVGSMRNHHNVRMIAGDERDALRELITTLRRGEFVIFAVDRWVMGPSSPWPLFGESARLPTAPFALAARSDAPVFLLAARRHGLDRFSGVIESLTPERVDSAAGEPLEDPAENGREATVARMRARVYPAIERMITQEPGQWVSALSVVWDGAPGGAR